MKEMKTQIDEEVMAWGILTRLPVKSLMRFKCVCKSWYALFKNSTFITAHRLFQQNNNYRFLVNAVKISEEEKAIALLSHETLEIESNLVVPLPIDSYCLSFVGSSSVNGILLVAISIPVLFNPATREFKVIPPSNLNGPDEDNAYAGYGFGYDPIKDDYKVVRAVRSIVYPPHSTRVSRYYFAEVYSLKRDCWRKLDVAINWQVAGNSTNNVFVNGMVHWMAKCKGDGRKMVLSFDMSTELFYTTYLPDLDGDVKTQQVVRVRESIAMITVRYTHTQLLVRSFDIWVLGEVGARASWSKYLTIGPLLQAEKPLGVGNNGEVFFLKDTSPTMNTASMEMGCYDPNTQMLRYLDFKLFRRYSALAIYSESLVSLQNRIDDPEVYPNSECLLF